MLRLFILCALIVSECVIFSCGKYNSGLSDSGLLIKKRREIRNVDSPNLIKTKSDDKKSSFIQGNLTNLGFNDALSSGNSFSNSQPTERPVAQNTIDNLRKIQTNIASPEAMKSIGVTLKVAGETPNFFNPQSGSFVANGGTDGYIDGDYNYQIIKLKQEEIEADPNLKDKVLNGKDIWSIYYADHILSAFGPGKDNKPIVSGELYSFPAKDSENTVTVIGFLSIEIERDPKLIEKIGLIFGTQETKNLDSIYSNGIIVDSNNTPQSGKLTIKYQCLGTSETSKTYDLGNLKEDEKKAIKELDIFNIL